MPMYAKLPGNSLSKPNLQIQHCNTFIFKVAALKSRVCTQSGKVRPSLVKEHEGQSIIV